MDHQGLINLGVGGVLTVLGWFARQLWDAVQELKKDMKSIELDLPKHYVRKDDLLTQLTKLEASAEVRRNEQEKRFDKQDIMLEKIFEKRATKGSHDECPKGQCYD